MSTQPADVRDTREWSLSERGHEALKSMGVYHAFLSKFYDNVPMNTLEPENLADYEQDGEPDYRDTNLAIDVILRGMIDNNAELGNYPLDIHVQERFRQMKYSDYQDATITTENLTTSRRNEFYKSASTWNVYGYVSKSAPANATGIIYETQPIRRAVINETIEYDMGFKYKPVKQRFLTIPFDAIDNFECESMRF